jgi:hypothetical protein
MKDDDRLCDRKRWQPLWWLLGFFWLVKDDDRSCDRKRWRWLWWLLGFVWLAWLLCSLVRLCRLVRREQVCPGGQTVPPWAYRQPDPLIYSQQYLQSLGLAVTWNNPDMHLELPSAVVENGAQRRVQGGALRIYFAGGAYCQISGGAEAALAAELLERLGSKR